MLERSVSYSGGRYEPCVEKLAAMDAEAQASPGDKCRRITKDEAAFAEAIPF